ncbi:hypothetical protein Zmor_018553 [Zophobas morio]|uniref:Uncharacterized protein n=1 Tax=Zophobas morio TaxID=2755281 RepID=A0AA38IEN7_9CUCU|nr:hypothetical protein Zmor_018553 [Zophobas morio]
MQSSLLCFFFITFISFVSCSIALFELSVKVTNVISENFANANESPNVTDPDSSNQKLLLLLELDSITVEVDEIIGQIQRSDKDKNSNIISRMSQNLPLMINDHKSTLKDIHMSQIYLNDYYKAMKKYIRDADEYNSTVLLDFADKVSSASNNSVSSMVKLLFEKVVDKSFIENVLKHLDPINNYYCHEKQSGAEILHTFMNEIQTINIKSYVSIYTAYMIKEIYSETKGSFKKAVVNASENFQMRTNNLTSTLKTYLTTASLELRRCDLQPYEYGETYLEIRNFLHGIIINKVNLDPNGSCNKECNAYSYIKHYNCGSNEWCWKEAMCSKVIGCQYVDSSMEVCPSKGYKTNRRYEYVKLGNGRVLGKEKPCDTDITSLETYRSWVFWKCSYCFCLCDEGRKFYTQNHINMRPVESNIHRNMVVTGLQFIEHNHVIHLQIQEGKLLPNGQIDLKSVQWLAPEDYQITQRNYVDGKDYHTLSWEKRSLQLVDIMAKEGNVVTGVGFVLDKFRNHLRLQVSTRPFNFTTGELTKTSKAVVEDSYEVGPQLKLDAVDIPTSSKLPPNQFTTNKFVKFTNSDFQKDAGQTTVPFLDAQPVESANPVPLSGVGIFHKGRPEFGGFIAPRIFTYNFTNHLEPIFSQLKTND